MQLRQIISTMDECPKGEPGRKLMQRLLGSYFTWKAGLGKLNSEQGSEPPHPESREGPSVTAGSAPHPGPINEALKRKQAYQKGQQSSANKRRRQRGGSSAHHAAGRFSSATDAAGQATFQAEAAQVSEL